MATIRKTNEENNANTGREFTFHFGDGRDVTGGWDPVLGAGTRIADMNKVNTPMGMTSADGSGAARTNPRPNLGANTVSGLGLSNAALNSGTTVGNQTGAKAVQSAVGGTVGLTGSGTSLYQADNGMTYTTANPLGAEKIINSYTDVINSEPGQKESDRTKAAWERLQQYNDSRPQYTQADAVTAALDRLRAAEAAKPGAYENQYAAQIDAVLDSLNNREGFSYDPAEDLLYKNYRDQYLRLGQRAMQDTLGNAAALSGGYGNSYAQAAGQQAYQNYLAGMNDALNSMYGQAYQEWQDQGTELYNRLNALNALENQDYERYRDALNDYLTERNYANTQYADERDTDYSRYRDTVGDWETDRNYWAGLYDTERANDRTDYANALAQWQADRTYWDGLVNNLIAYNGIMGGTAEETATPTINVTVNPQAAWSGMTGTAAYGAKSGTKGGTGADEALDGTVEPAPVQRLAAMVEAARQARKAAARNTPTEVDAVTGADPGLRKKRE